MDHPPEPRFPKSYCVLRGNELIGIYDWLADALEARGDGCQVFERLTRQTGTCMEHRGDLLDALKDAVPFVREAGKAVRFYELIAKVDAYLLELDEACAETAEPSK